MKVAFLSKWNMGEYSFHQGVQSLPFHPNIYTFTSQDDIQKTKHYFTF